MDEKPTESTPPESIEEAPADPPNEGESNEGALDDDAILFDDDDDDDEEVGADDEPELPELFGLPPITDATDATDATGDDDPDVDDLIRACRHGIHESNNALTGLMHECELATLSDDPQRLKLAIERISTQADALARINREMRAALGKFPAGR